MFLFRIEMFAQLVYHVTYLKEWIKLECTLDSDIQMGAVCCLSMRSVSLVYHWLSAVMLFRLRVAVNTWLQSFSNFWHCSSNFLDDKCAFLDLKWSWKLIIFTMTSEHFGTIERAKLSKFWDRIFLSCYYSNSRPLSYLFRMWIWSHYNGLLDLLWRYYHRCSPF